MPGEASSFVHAPSLNCDSDTKDRTTSRKKPTTGSVIGVIAVRPRISLLWVPRYNMHELRPCLAGRSEIRMLFAFDPKHRATLLVAGAVSVGNA